MIAAEPVVVVGGGLAGLSVAHRLSRRSTTVILLEAGARLGGQIHTVVEDHAVVELGAEGFVARSTAVPRLCQELGCETELVDQLTTLTFAATDAGLVPLAPGEAAELLGFQVPREELGRGIRSLSGGMGALVERLSESLANRADLRVLSPVSSVEPVSTGLSVALESGERLAARAVVVATPSRSAASILAAVSHDRSRVLEEARLLSSLSVTLLFERRSVKHDLRASGFIVPVSKQVHGFRACSFASSKFADRVDGDRVLLRAFFRPEAGAIDGTPDAEWIDRALAVISPVLGLSGSASRAWVSAWHDALPIHDEPHRRNVHAVEAAIEPHAVYLAGSAFHGAGIDAALVSAELAASKILGE